MLGWPAGFQAFSFLFDGKKKGYLSPNIFGYVQGSLGRYGNTISLKKKYGNTNTPLLISGDLVGSKLTEMNINHILKAER